MQLLTKSPEPEVSAQPAVVGRRRVQLDFMPDAYQQLRTLQTATRSRSIADVIRTALSFLDWYLEKKREGYRLQMRNKDGEVIGVELPLNM